MVTQKDSEPLRPTSVEEIRGWIVRELSERLGVDARSINALERFSRYGLDSIGAARLLADLGLALGRSLAPTLAWEYPFIEALARYLAEGAGEPSTPPGALAGRAPVDEPIAIIGLACRFPKAPTPEAFWQLLRDGVDAITVAPPGRLDASVLYNGDSRAPATMNTRRGGFLDHVDEFDPLFFGISPREATYMDPQQRLMLELSWEALEDAGLPVEKLRGTQTGVFCGVIWADYATLLYRSGPESISQYTVSGHHYSIVANRVSYVLGLQGPSMAIDSACSSSLVAVHLACESLRRGESTLALAGGVNLNLLPESMDGVEKFGALSPDGRCFTFDARANGYVRGEGGGVVVLKRLSRAIANGDQIYCVIRGSAVNNDGASNGLTAPNPMAQQALLRLAYERAGVDPAEVQYIEAHGTGTQLGDPIEAKALGAVLGANRPVDRPLLVGSAKTNVGHLEGAAGIVGLIKTALSIKHRQLAPSLHFEAPNVHIPFSDLRLRVQSCLGSWPEEERRLTAGVSAFGLGGTNSHIVLQEWLPPRAEMIPLSAESDEALRTLVQRFVAGSSSPTGYDSFRALCGAAAARLSAHEHRIAVIARSHAELGQRLQGVLDGKIGLGVSVGRAGAGPPPKVTLVFSGQGAQWFGMGRSLLQSEPLFRATLERCDRFVQQNLGWSLLAELTASQENSRLDDISVSLPAIISLEIAVAALWRSWGIEPDAVVGHSTGEIAAAHVAGVLSLEDAMRTICAYGRIIGRLRGQGAMGVVMLSWKQAEEALVGYEGRVFRAIQHSADTTVLAGYPDALDAVLKAVARQNVFCRRVKMDVAPHCPLVDSLRDELFEALREVRPQRSQVPIISEVTATALDGQLFDASHWVRNFGDPAFFSAAIDHLVKQGYCTFLEVSPHPLVTHAIETNLRHAGVRGVVLPSLRREEEERELMLGALGSLYTLGLPVKWKEICPISPQAGQLIARDRDDVPERLGEEVDGGAPIYVLPLSARDPRALSALARSYRAFVAEAPLALRDIAYTASVRRNHHEYRLAVLGRSREDLCAALEAFLCEKAHPGAVWGQVKPGPPPKVVFVFSGQGSQWVGMGRRLMESEPVFRDSLAASDALVKRHAGVSLLEELTRPEASTRLGETEIAQPALFAIEIALAALLSSWGITPDAVLGHSVGEVSAAHVAGALSHEEAVRLVVLRGRVMQKATGRGKMVAVALSVEEAERAIEGQRDRLGIAAINDPGAVVFSGDGPALDALVEQLKARGVVCRDLPVNYAFHSPQMADLQEELTSELGGVETRGATIAMYSTVKGAKISAQELDAAYWGRGVRAPVNFASAVMSALGDGRSWFLEIGPHPVVSANIAQCIATVESDGHVFQTLRRAEDERRHLLMSLGALSTRGYQVAWERIIPTGGRCVSLPTYPWQRERFWVEGAASDRVEDRSGDGPRDALEQCLYAVAWRRADLPTTAAPEARGAWLVFADEGGTAEGLMAQLRARGGSCIKVVAGEGYARIEHGIYRINPSSSEDYRALLSETLGSQATCRGVVHLFSLDARPPAETTVATLAADQRRGCVSALYLTQALLRHGFRDTPPLWLITRGAQVVLAGIPPVAISQAPLWGLGRTIALEHPELRCARVDLDPAPSDEDAARLLRELGSTDREDQIALREDGRYVARLVRSRFGAAGAPARRTPANGRLFRLEISAPGALDRLSLQEASQAAPGPGEVEIEIEATGLNWFDVQLALGTSPDEAGETPGGAPRLGMECAGRIIAVGEGVTDLHEGQDVIALGFGGLSSRMTTKRMLVVPKPARLLWEQAATLPIAFLTACHALDRVARLREGERVLIHADAGGVGMAAVQWARRIGAEIFATASSEAAREQLRALGATHVMDSSSLQFADEVRRATNDEGVDVVLNSLSGDFIRAGLDLLRDDGRFIEIGKRDKTLDLEPFLRGLPFSLIDVPGMIRRRPSLVGTLLAHVASLVDAGALDPLPIQSFPISRASEAFRRMEQGEHIGKIAVTLKDPAAGIAAAERESGVRPDASYLITGGLGGLGLAVARWMVEQGARDLALVGRHEPGEAARKAICALEEAGARVLVVQADVSQRGDVIALLSTVEQRLAPLRGVVHAAGVLDDHIVLDLREDHFLRVAAPKILGAFNLHELTRDYPLDFFVLYSSAAALLGSPGQGNYTAANAFLEALSHDRQRAGLPAMSIQWGAFSQVGLAAAREVRGERLSFRGIEPLTPEQGNLALARLLKAPRAEIGVVQFDVRRWLEFYPAAAALPFFAEVQTEPGKPSSKGADAGRIQKALSAAEPESRLPLLEGHVAEQLGRVLHLDPSRIDRFAPLSSLGMDSLMSLELRNGLAVSLGLKLPPTLLYTYSHAASLAEHLMGLLGFSATPVGQPHPILDEKGPPLTPSETLELDSLGKDELLALLEQSFHRVEQEMSK